MSFGTTGVTLSTKITEKEYWSTSPQPAFGKQFLENETKKRPTKKRFLAGLPVVKLNTFKGVPFILLFRENANIKIVFDF